MHRAANAVELKTTRARTSSRNKREEILAQATYHFGHDGYEHSKWADVAGAVGIGSTALYHYFESKLHCLYEIQANALQSFLDEFRQITSDIEDFEVAIVTVLRSAYDLTEDEVLRNRVLAAEQSLLGVRRDSPREEEARRLARTRTRDLEFAWATYLVRGMQQGLLPEADPRLLTRAVLGLHNSVWHWFRPQGELPLSDVADFYVRRCLAVLGLPEELADRKLPAGERRTPVTAASRAKGAVARRRSKNP